MICWAPSENITNEESNGIKSHREEGWMERTSRKGRAAYLYRHSVTLRYKGMIPYETLDWGESSSKAARLSGDVLVGHSSEWTASTRDGSRTGLLSREGQYAVPENNGKGKRNRRVNKAGARRTKDTLRNEH